MPPVDVLEIFGINIWQGELTDEEMESKDNHMVLQ